MYRSSVKVFLAGTNSQMSLVGLIGRLCANHSKYLTTRLLSQSSSVSGDDGSFFALNEDQLCQVQDSVLLFSGACFSLHYGSPKGTSVLTLDRSLIFENRSLIFENRSLILKNRSLIFENRSLFGKSEFDF